MSVILNGSTGITTPGLINTGTETIVNLTTTGNTILGDASTDTLNVGNGGLVKDASGNVGIGTASPAISGSAFTTLNVKGVSNTTALITATSGDLASSVQLYSGASTSDNPAIGYQKALRFGSTTDSGIGGFTERMRLDSSGNLGLGVTPSAWGTNAIQIGATGGASLSYTAYTAYLSANAYYTAGGWRYIGPNAASSFAASGNVFYWFQASAGTAGNLVNGTGSFTQAMTLDSSGRLLIGATSGASTLVVANSSLPEINIKRGALQGVVINQFDGTGNSSVNVVDSAALLFGTNNTERMRIDASGNLLVGTTSLGANSAKMHIATTAANGNRGLEFTGTVNTFSLVVGFNNTNGTVGSIQTNGSSTTYATSSDYRLKDITGPVTGAKEFIMALQPKQGTWKVDGAPFVGFLAHEFQEVSPTSVSGEKDEVDAEGNPVMQAMQASTPEVMANLVALIQEQQAMIDELKAKVAALEAA